MKSPITLAVGYRNLQLRLDPAWLQTSKTISAASDVQDINYKDRGVQEKDSCKVQDKLLTMFYAAMTEKWLLSTTTSSWCTFICINMDKLKSICQIKLVHFWLIQYNTGSIPDNCNEDEQKMNGWDYFFLRKTHLYTWINHIFLIQLVAKWLKI